MPQLPWMPRIDYGPSGFWMATVPTRIWDKIIMMTGGGDRAATWLGATYEISRAYMLAVTIRYHETEENDLFDAIDYLRSWPNTGTLYPDQLDTGTFFEVDVQEPAKGENLQGQQDRDYPEVREIRVVFRNVAGTEWPLQWFT